MIALSAIQTTVQQALATAFAGRTVIADLGTQSAAIETALRTDGFVVVVLPILSADRADTSGMTRTALLNAEFNVRLLVDAEVNNSANGAHVDIYAAVVTATSAVLSISPGAGERRFEAAPAFMHLVTYDEGLLGYDLTFRKQSAVN